MSHLLPLRHLVFIRCHPNLLFSPCTFSHTLTLSLSLSLSLPPSCSVSCYLSLYSFLLLLWCACFPACFVLSLQLLLCLWLLYHISPPNHLALVFLDSPQDLFTLLNSVNSNLYISVFSVIQSELPQFCTPHLSVNKKHFGSFIPASASESALGFPCVRFM